MRKHETYLAMEEQIGPETRLDEKELKKIFPRQSVRWDNTGVTVSGGGQYAPSYAFSWAWPLPQAAASASATPVYVTPIYFVEDAEIARVTSLEIDGVGTPSILLGTQFAERTLAPRKSKAFWIARPEQIVDAQFAMLKVKFSGRHPGVSRATLLTNPYLIDSQDQTNASGSSGTTYVVLNWGAIDTAAKTKLVERYMRAVAKRLESLAEQP